jgi:hypothetical protein
MCQECQNTSFDSEKRQGSVPDEKQCRGEEEETPKPNASQNKGEMLV